MNSDIRILFIQAQDGAGAQQQEAQVQRALAHAGVEMVHCVAVAPSAGISKLSRMGATFTGVRRVRWAKEPGR